MSLRLGVSIPFSSVKSVVSTRYLRIASACDTALLASATAASSSALRSSSSRRSAIEVSFGLPLDSSQPGSASSSRVISAAMNGLLVADHDALADQRVGAQPVLQDGGGDVLAARGDQQLLLAAGDLQEAVGVELADVAGVEEAVAVDGLLRGLLVVPVAAHDDAALDEHLAVVGDRHGHAGQRPPDGADPQRLLVVHRRGGGGLGEPVALVDHHADAAVEVAQPVAQRRAAGDRADALAAEGRPQPGVDQLVEQRVLGLAAPAPGRRRPARATSRRPPAPRGRRSCPCRRSRRWPWPGCRPSRTPAARPARTSAGRRRGPRSGSSRPACGR